MSARNRPGGGKAQRVSAAQAARAVAARRQRRRTLLVRSGAVAVVAAVGVFILVRAGGGNGSASSHPSFVVGHPGPGADAPPIQLASTAGGTFNLSAQRGKTVLLYFQEGIGCQPCWDQMHAIEQNWQQFQRLGVNEFVAITGDSLDQLRQKVSDEGLHTPVLADPKLSLGPTYETNQFGMMGMSAYGHSFLLVGPDGKIVWRADYGGSPNYTMYVGPPALLADLRAGIGTTKTT